MSRARQRRDRRVPFWWWLSSGGVILGWRDAREVHDWPRGGGGGVSFLFAGSWRRWVGGYVVHARCRGARAASILIHNIRHDFASIRYQWAHSMSSPNPGFGPFARVRRAAKFSDRHSAPHVCSCGAIWRWRAKLLADPRLRVCLCLFVLPFAFFLLKATRGRIEGNWAFPSVLSGVLPPLAAEWHRRVRDIGRGGVGLCEPRLLVTGGGEPVLPRPHHRARCRCLPVASDRVTRGHTMNQPARAVASRSSRGGHTGPVYVPTYQWIICRGAGTVSTPGRSKGCRGRATSRNTVARHPIPRRCWCSRRLPCARRSFRKRPSRCRRALSPSVRGSMAGGAGCYELFRTGGRSRDVMNTVAGAGHLDPPPHYPPR